LFFASLGLAVKRHLRPVALRERKQHSLALATESLELRQMKSSLSLEEEQIAVSALALEVVAASLEGS